MGLFKKREQLPLTTEERDGLWTRPQIMQHWRTISPAMKPMAITHATDDQLRVMGWDLPNPSDRILATSEAMQRRAQPQLRRKIEAYVSSEAEDVEEVTDAELETWIAPLQEIHQRAATKDIADRRYREVYGGQ